MLLRGSQLLDTVLELTGRLENRDQALLTEAYGQCFAKVLVFV
jgi:hypothetical protein